MSRPRTACPATQGRHRIPPSKYGRAHPASILASPDPSSRLQVPRSRRTLIFVFSTRMLSTMEMLLSARLTKWTRVRPLHLWTTLWISLLLRQSPASHFLVATHLLPRRRTQELTSTISQQSSRSTKFWPRLISTRLIGLRSFSRSPSLWFSSLTPLQLQSSKTSLRTSTTSPGRRSCRAESRRWRTRNWMTSSSTLN